MLMLLLSWPYLSVIDRLEQLNFTTFELEDQIQETYKEAEKKRNEAEVLALVLNKVREDMVEVKRRAEEAECKVASLQTVMKQAENQQREYLRLIDENTRLIQLVERLDKEKENLISRLQCKAARQKKDD
jgi:hypothetical protein